MLMPILLNRTVHDACTMGFFTNAVHSNLPSMCGTVDFPFQFSSYFCCVQCHTLIKRLHAGITKCPCIQLQLISLENTEKGKGTVKDCLNSTKSEIYLFIELFQTYVRNYMYLASALIFLWLCCVIQSIRFSDPSALRWNPQSLSLPL